MKTLIFTTSVIALSLFTAACQKTENNASAAAPFDNIADAATPTTSGGIVCAFDNGRNRNWTATVNEMLPKPPGGRALAVNGEVQVSPGYSPKLSPAGLNKSNPPDQLFALDLVEDAARKTGGWQKVSASVPPPIMAKNVVIECGGVTLVTEEIQRPQ